MLKFSPKGSELNKCFLTQHCDYKVLILPFSFIGSPFSFLLIGLLITIVTIQMKSESQ